MVENTSSLDTPPKLPEHIREALVKGGIGTFSETKGVIAGTVFASRYKAIMHRSPEGVLAVCSVKSDRYSAGSEGQVFRQLAKVAEQLGVGDKEQEVSVSVTYNRESPPAPISVKMDIDLRMPLNSPQRGDVYSVKVTGVEHYGTGKCSSMGLALQRVSCSNLEIFDLDSVWSATVKHIGDYTEKVSSNLPTREIIQERVLEHLNSLQGLDEYALSRRDFLMALHYTIHGTPTSRRLLNNHYTQHCWGNVHSSTSLESVSGNGFDVFVEEVNSPRGTRTGWECTESGYISTTRELSKTMSAYMQHLPAPYSSGYSSDDRGLTLMGLRQAVTGFLTQGGVCKTPAEIGGTKSTATNKEIQDRLELINSRFKGAFDEHRGSLQDLEGKVSRLPFNLIPSNREVQSGESVIGDRWAVKPTVRNNTELFFKVQ